MSTVISIISAVLIFCVIVIVHEFGHFIVARKCGIDVQEFAIGMGPVIFKKQGKNTLFTIRLLPLGGFCSMGEDEDSEDENSFRKKPVGRRIAVIAAGAVMNLILGFIIALIIFLVSGKLTTTIIAEVTPGSGCEAAGMVQGDRIVKVNGLHIFTANDIIYQLRNDEDGVLDFVVERNGEKISLDGVKFGLTIDEETGERVLNYDFKVYLKDISAAELLPAAANKFMYYSRLILMSLRDLISGKYGLNNLQGPVGIVTVISESAQKSGFDIGYLLDIAMLISVNVGIFNLLPLPALDGGRLVFLIVEAIRRKPIKAETEGMVHFAGFALLMLLMIIVTFNDVKNIFV
ncbi:MAG: RIP metalloprotease RseP [Oscillospiraceae bacterium]|nr:RIP metalloprotease RseP [Oscillospiraceae bacterium]MDY3790905.1 RIP metalloprotease RseP [Oscillospiraceae bacterium]MDY6208851.1 RIP metalloprotease RseP [Oscillospiraceae bacterium]